MITNNWTYHGEPFVEPGEYYGFVYCITNLLSGKRYIGKKFFWSVKRKQVNKVRKRYKVESDWKEYWSSSEDLKEDVRTIGPKHFKREILHLCKNKGTTNYLEAKEQFLREVLESKDWYNSWIQVKVHRSHYKP
jgi:phosphoserine aminotransferase